MKRVKRTVVCRKHGTSAVVIVPEDIAAMDWHSAQWALTDPQWRRLSRKLCPTPRNGGYRDRPACACSLGYDWADTASN